MLEKETTSDAVIQMEKKLRYISNALKNKGRKILQHYPITSAQFIALQWLLDRGDMTIGELSKKIGLAFSTTTDLVDRMEMNDLVERIRESTDRRVVRIHLLEKGKNIIHEVIEKRQDFLDDVLQHFSLEEISTLYRLLDKLYGEMQRVSED